MLVFAALLGCASGPPDVVIVLVDTLRADHMGLYGYDLDTTPNIDDWAREGVVFERHIAQAGYTLPSVSSLMTGMRVSAHGCCVIFEETLAEEHETLAEVFSQAGYHTRAFSQSYALSEIAPEQGFDAFETLDPTKSADDSGAQLALAIHSWFDGQDKKPDPRFLYLHFMDPHHPYRAPDGWYGRYDEGYDSAFNGSDLEMDDLVLDPRSATAADIDKLNALYDEEITYLDSLLVDVLERAEEAAGRRGAIVVLTGDHGEQFGEHGTFLHKDLYQENIHVPLIVRGAGLSPGEVDDWTQTIDLLPTLAALTEVTPGTRWQGRDLSSALQASGGVEAALIHSDHGASVQALIDPSGLKYIKQQGREFLFDLNIDPEELMDLSDAMPDEVDRLRGELESLLEADALLRPAE